MQVKSETPSEEHLVVAWDPPVDPPGAPVTTYRLQVSKNATSGFFNLEGSGSAEG